MPVLPGNYINPKSNSMDFGDLILEAAKRKKEQEEAEYQKQRGYLPSGYCCTYEIDMSKTEHDPWCRKKL